LKVPFILRLKFYKKIRNEPTTNNNDRRRRRTNRKK